ncbi:MAG: hypothetical protein B7Y83_00230 [Flavobacteriales bacterium 32-34-25]|nr:MAG: hypothetical protein B7Y83_00230 [Flavobacteriales bacterium 32-34-25]
MDTLTILYSIAVLALICAVVLAFSGVRTGGRTVPEPPEHLRTKKKGSALKMRNPPPPPEKNIQNAVPRIQNADELLNKTIGGIPNFKCNKWRIGV